MSLSHEPLRRAACAVALACGMGSIAIADEAATSPAPAQAPSPTPSAVPEGWRLDGLGFRNGKSKIHLAGYIQEDLRHYDWTVKGDEEGSLRAPTDELRRLRVGFEGNLGNMTFEFVMDPRSSQAPDRLKDATLGYNFSKSLHLLAGHFKPPVSQEYLTSAGKTDFVDRSMLASNLNPDREWGAELSGEPGRVEYHVGVFAGDGAANTYSADTSVAFRFGVKPVKGLLVSGSFMQGDVTPDPRVGATEPSPKGAHGQTATGYTYWNRAHVKGTRRRLGGDLTYSRGPFRLQAEYLQLGEERKGQGSTGQDIPEVVGRGWNAQVTYVLTGEKKGSTVTPGKSIFQGGFGAVELAARVEGLKFDDTGDSSGFAGYGNRARNIAPSGATSIVAGINYWPSNFLKVQGNALWESYNDPLIAPVPGKTGRYFSLIARLQVMVP
ncbi:MAG: OprO/OprP family phosphate-selective porin [Vicinamibacteria bacterium]|nr:OprO/OprP family phosphate-selective porin [Vicinamibacteria bacterium]